MAKKWILEGFFGSQTDLLQRIELKNLPAIVGRDPALPLAIVRSEISRNHAEFFLRGADLMLRDLNSTNGTFINHAPLKGETTLRHGDVIHFASCEVRILEEQDVTHVPGDDGTMTRFSFMPLSNKLPTGLNELQVLLDQRAINAEFQPIVGIDGTLYGYEVLGRGGRQDLPISPMELFRIAESLSGKAAELSVLMRDCGVEQAASQGVKHRLFMNTHPEEMKDVDGLLNSIKGLQQRFGHLQLVLEIHEDAITDLKLMKRFAEELIAIGVELAYDDFGAGQARLMEMIEIPVKYVKFDIALIRGLHNAPEAKRKMVAALAAMTRAMGIQALAEGVEYPEELALCEAMQFDLIQGYFFGKPSRSLDYKNPLAH